MLEVGTGASRPLDHAMQQRPVFRVDSSADQLERHGHTGVEFEDAIELSRPCDLVRRTPPGEAAGQAEALSLREKCLAAPQSVFAFRDGTQIVACLRLFARRDVLERQENPALWM